MKESMETKVRPSFKKIYYSSIAREGKDLRPL